MENEKQKSGRGGRREGAGRKPSEIPCVNVTMRVPQFVKDKLQSVADSYGISLSRAFTLIVESYNS